MCGVMKGKLTHSGITLGITKCEINENVMKNIQVDFGCVFKPWNKL